ncbi:MAG: TIM-barrel domain-containing protein [Candidatus Izemoplasmatales bacterium]
MNDHPYPMRLDANGVANPGNVVRFKHYRFTLLADRLVRIEFSATNDFVDEPSQSIWHRDAAPVAFEKKMSTVALSIETAALRITVSDGELLIADAMRILVKSTKAVWQFGSDGENLGGTARTLDGVDGKMKLGDGVVGKSGFAVLDDSKSLLLDQYGWPKTRRSNGTDIYFFGYGHDYEAAVQAYVAISGHAPLIPRYILGNWWSKYWAYTDRELLGIVDRFRAEGVPLSICIVDMDWHITAIDGVQDYWGGWTGYTVNRKYFPDFPGFIAELHARGVRTSVNLHPANGVKSYEIQYEAMAARMGIDPATKAVVPFDAASPKAMAAYFEILLHPYEDMGVDFWWVDWQQGSRTRVEGLDPLWMLNHLHHYDSARDPKKRPFTFSRWCGYGAQRYPIGFSGDAIITWDSLRYQPTFTATAANIGFGLWSHDIGGHYGGKEDPELYARWVEFGVFSPIMRMHSTSNRFATREPWRHAPGIRAVVGEFLRLRHRLVPYLYTAARIDSSLGRPMIRPLYYAEPEQEKAYEADGVYSFGSEMVVAPVTEPIDPRTTRASVEFYLPKGVWTHFFTDEIVPGGKSVRIHTALEHQNAFVREGGIVVLAADPMAPAGQNPSAFDVRVYPGADNLFTLYEDDGDSSAYREGDCHETRFALVREGGRTILRIMPDKTERSYIPPRRSYVVSFVNLTGDVAGFDHAREGSRLVVRTGEVSSYQKVEIVVDASVRTAGRAAALSVLDRMLVDVILNPDLKTAVWNAFQEAKSAEMVEKSFKRIPPHIRAMLEDFARLFPFRGEN